MPQTPQVPPEIVQYLQQLEAILVRWHANGYLGEVATIFGPTLIQAEERRRHVTVKVQRSKPGVRAKVVGRVR